MLTPSKRLLRLIVLPCLLIAGTAGIAQGAWIYAKAWLAQLLIESAWQQTLLTGEPVKPWPWADTWPVGRLHLDEHGVDLYTLNGHSGSALAFGPGQLNLNNTTQVIAGHRDTHFQFMEKLEKGQALFLTSPNGHTQAYSIAELFIVDTNTDTLNFESEIGQIFLITCYPFNTINTPSTLRYVAKGNML